MNANEQMPVKVKAITARNHKRHRIAIIPITQIEDSSPKKKIQFYNKQSNNNIHKYLCRCINHILLNS